MESRQVLAQPSTSQESFHTNLGEQETDEDNIVAMRCLELIEKIASKLISDTSEFVDILQKILAAMEDKSVNRDLKHDLIDMVMSNIMDADKEELTSIKDDFKKIFCTREVRNLLVDDSAVISIKPIGKGVFGFLTTGILKKPGGKAIEVAIKSAKALEYREMLENEGSILCQLNHKNIIKILAITKSESYIVTELMDLGNLVMAVGKMNFTTSNLLNILSDVANGMEYLHGKKYLLRDLACNTVFLNSKKKCKIGDFTFCVYVGDSEGVYVEKVHDMKGYYLSPETLISKEFTMATDVWSMGILCWELFYLVEHANELLSAVIKLRTQLRNLPHFQERLVKPKPCPENLYAYINQQLLEENPNARPSFTAIKGKLTEFISSS